MARRYRSRHRRLATLGGLFRPEPEPTRDGNSLRDFSHLAEPLFANSYSRLPSGSGEGVPDPALLRKWGMAFQEALHPSVPGAKRETQEAWSKAAQRAERGRS